MIVKVQLSLNTTEPRRQVLIYNESRTVEWQGDESPEIVEAMCGMNKCFFEARLNGTVIELLKRVGGREW